MVNGEFLATSKDFAPWELSTTQINGEVVTHGAYSGNSMLKLTVPVLTGVGQLSIQTSAEAGKLYAQGRTLFHLIQGVSYKISFIVGTDLGQQGRVKASLWVANPTRGPDVGRRRSPALIHDFDWISVSAIPTMYNMSYQHNTTDEMDVRLELDVGSVQQVLYLDKVNFVREDPAL